MAMLSSRLDKSIAEGKEQHKGEMPELSIRPADPIADLNDCLYIVGFVFVLPQQGPGCRTEISNSIAQLQMLPFEQSHKALRLAPISGCGRTWI